MPQAECWVSVDKQPESRRDDTSGCKSPYGARINFPRYPAFRLRLHAGLRLSRPCGAASSLAPGFELSLRMQLVNLLFGMGPDSPRLEPRSRGPRRAPVLRSLGWRRGGFGVSPGRKPWVSVNKEPEPRSGGTGSIGGLRLLASLVAQDDRRGERRAPLGMTTTHFLA